MLAETFIIIGIMLVGIVGPCTAVAVLGHAALGALARNPSAAAKIFWGMAILVIFVIAISAIAILIIFQLFGKT